MSTSLPYDAFGVIVVAMLAAISTLTKSAAINGKTHIVIKSVMLRKAPVYKYK